MTDSSQEAVLKAMKVAELRELARRKGIAGYESIGKVELRSILLNCDKDKPSKVLAKPRLIKKGAQDHSTQLVNPPEGIEEEARTTGSEIEDFGYGKEKTEYFDNSSGKTEDQEISADYQEPEEAEKNEEVIRPSVRKPNETTNIIPPDQQGNRYEVCGILELAENGFGFLRFNNFLTSEADVYVAPAQVKRFRLKTGDKIYGIARRPNKDEKFGALLYLNLVNDDELHVAMNRRDFSKLTPIFPNERIKLEQERSNLAARLIDLVSPIGKGQRGLIVAPPKAGKTVLLKNIANQIEKTHPEIEMIILLVDERPEEVTDMQRSVKGDVIYSTFDEMPQHHVKVAEMVLARAQRLVEHKKDVVILLDSITRLARAYNLVIPPSGKTLSGGIDPGALYSPKKFFGAARNMEEGGSITILATALVETGSRMDDVIFEEFKGTGNMELHLDRKLSEKRIFPAINLNKSGTRREDLLLSKEELEAIWVMRRAMSNIGTQEVTESIIDNLQHTDSNHDFVQIIRRVYDREK